MCYSIAAQTTEFDIEMPALCSTAPAPCLDVRHTVRDVILARNADDRRGDRLDVTRVQTGAFSTVCTLIPIVRGWVAADVKMRDRRFRFISTHLDGDCLPVTSVIQQAQANEILAGPTATSMPLVLVGDLNSPADGTGVTYTRLLKAGFTYAFLAGGGDGAAVTCCQADNLMNPISELSRRIDHVLVRGVSGAEDADVVGEAVADRTPGELWPSDHAGVVVTVNIPR